jgi:hypothetical protein
MFNAEARRTQRKRGDTHDFLRVISAFSAPPR